MIAPAPTVLSAEFIIVEPAIMNYWYSIGRHRVLVAAEIVSCSCGNATCTAAKNVLAYLASGGERAPEPPSGYFLGLPEKCPVCGAKVYADTSLDSPHRGTGWKCSSGNKSHYWQTLGRAPRDRCECNAYPVPHKRGLGKCEQLTHSGQSDPLPERETE